MANRISFNDINDFSGSEDIVPGAGIYAVLLRKDGLYSKLMYKFNLDSLSTFFLAKSEIDTVKRKIDNFENSLESLTETFLTTDYLEENDYIMKYEADKNRSKLATEESVKSAITNYMTHGDLRIDEQESARHAYECASSYATSMAMAAVTARSTNASNNTAIANNENLTEAIDGIKEEED